MVVEIFISTTNNVILLDKLLYHFLFLGYLLV